MARRLVDWWPAAFVGGLLYGFSPFTAATGNGHLFLLFQAVPPLVILFVDRFMRQRSASPWWTGLAVGLCFVAEFYISTEVFASLVVMTGIASVVAGGYTLLRRVEEVSTARVWRRWGPTRPSSSSWGPATGPGWRWPAPSASPAPGAAGLRVIAGESIDPFGLVVPTLDQRFTLGHATLGGAPTWPYAIPTGRS